MYSVLAAAASHPSAGALSSSVLQIPVFFVSATGCCAVGYNTEELKAFPGGAYSLVRNTKTRHKIPMKNYIKDWW